MQCKLIRKIFIYIFFFFEDQIIDDFIVISNIYFHFKDYGLSGHFLRMFFVQMDTQ